MRKADWATRLLLALALFLPVLLNLLRVAERSSTRSSVSELEKDFGFGKPPFDFRLLPFEARRGRYRPARVLPFFSGSALRTYFFACLPEKEKARIGSAVIGPGPTLAGIVTKVLPFSSVFLVRHVEDPGFFVEVRTESGRIFVLQGRGLARGLSFCEEPASLKKGEVVKTTGKGGVFPEGIPVGFIEIKAGEAIVRPAFALEDCRWVLLWENPDLEILSRTIEGSGLRL